VRIVESNRAPDFSTADPLLPPQLFPYPIEAIHESRSLNRLSGYVIEAPSVTLSGISPQPAKPPWWPKGDVEPELVFETDALTATAMQLAANTGLKPQVSASGLLAVGSCA
jgi:hypothetical protein